LDREAAKGARLPGADVADFAVVVVVPALAGDGVGDRFAKLVGRGGGERIEGGSACRTRAMESSARKYVKAAAVPKMMNVFPDGACPIRQR